jgi:hypothetical protein
MFSRVKSVVVFVESPFQLANAFEFSQLQPSVSWLIIVRLNGDKKNDDAILRAADNNQRSNVKIKFLGIPRKGVRKFYGLCRLLSVLPLLWGVGEVIFFDDRSVVFRLLKRVMRRDVYLADDGAYSFVKIKELEKSREKIAGLITRFKEIESQSVNIIHVPYKEITVKTANYALVVGMPVCEKGIISKESYLSFVNLMLNKAESITGHKAYYFPHRSESAYRDLGIPVILSDLSVEEYIEENMAAAPSAIVSMYSTALFVVSSKFLGVRCFYFRLPELEIKSEVSRKNIALVYEGLNKSRCDEVFGGGRPN